MNNIYISSIIVFLAVILLLVVILLVAKSYLVASGKVKVTINGDKELEVNSGASLLSTLAENGVYLLNPGSVSLPKNSHPCSYGLFDETGFTVYTKDHEAYMHIDL